MFSYFAVRGQSMEPLCREGDFILLDKLAYKVSAPKVGDIVVLKHPYEQERLLLKYIMERKVKDGELVYWVEGINKELSSDSRHFGWINKNLILGRAKVIHRAGFVS